MPTFQNPVEDADEAREALRGLAYATRHFDAAEDTYPVLGSITRSVEGLQQVLEQLATWHRTNQHSAVSDTGDRAAGALEAVRAADALTRAAETLDRAWEAVNAAWSHNGTIAWQPDIPTTTPPPYAASGARSERDSTERVGTAGAEDRWHVLTPLRARDRDVTP